MNFKKLNLVNKQNFTKLCLILFREYRSAKFKKNNIIFWKKNLSLFDNRLEINISDLIFKHIPIQLSLFKWRSKDKYNDYLEEINFIFEEGKNENINLNSFNTWFAEQINGTIMMDISTHLLEQERIFINNKYHNRIKPKRKIKDTLIIRTDVFEPLIQRVKDFSLVDANKKIKFAFQAAIIALFIKTQVLMTPLADKEPSFFVNIKKESTTTQLFFQKKLTREAYKTTENNKSNNNTITFDSS